jgi:hypothetical protein
MVGIKVEIRMIIRKFNALRPATADNNNPSEE